MKVYDIKSQKVVPKVLDPALQNLLPTVLFREEFSFTIDGPGSAVANAIRRTITGQLLVKYMHAEIDDIEASDPQIDPAMIVSRLRMIPILQSVPTNAVFHLSVVNKTTSYIDAKSSDIVGAEKYVNETIPICAIDRLYSLVIKKITIATAYTFTSQYGMCAMASGVRSVSLDVKKLHMYENARDGTSISISNPRVHKISFSTNGTISGRELVVRACANIVDRMKTIYELAADIQGHGDEYILDVPEECHTMGRLFEQITCELYPTIRFVASSPEAFGRGIKLKIAYNDNIDHLFAAVRDRVVSIMEEISSVMST